MDEVAYDVIALLDKGLDRQTVINDTLKKHGDKPDVTKEELEELLADIDRLIAEGSLFAPDTYEDKAFDFKERSTVIKALCLHVAHTATFAAITASQPGQVHA